VLVILPDLHNLVKIELLTAEDFMPTHIEVNPNVCHGKPVIRGTRIMVRTILGALAGGDSISDILENYPGLTFEDVEAAVAYAIELVDDTQVSISVS
jgi:uncharacterized protein (DUF433 family)